MYCSYVSVIPADVQDLVLNKEVVPEEQRPYVDQQEREHINTQEDEEELWTSLEDKQLNLEKENDANSLFTAVSLKVEDDEDKPQFVQLHQDQVEVRDLSTRSLADDLE